MRLDDITTHIRLRSAWEAVDLGFAMVQHYWRDVWPTWTLLLFSISALVWFLLPVTAKPYAPLLVWWLKPLYDRVLLQIYSQRLFNRPVSTASIVNQLPHLLSHTGLFAALTWRRLSPSRGFNLPIWQLEQLRGKARKARQHLLHLHTYSYAVWLIVACAHLEYVLIFSLYALIVFVDPTDKSWDYITAAFTESFDPQLQYWGSLLYLLVYTVTIWVIEPFYLAASFSLYLNRRTQLEAWDIELAFRSLADRLQAMTQTTVTLALAIGMLLAGLILTTPMSAWAAPSTHEEIMASKPLPPQAARVQIDEVMQQDEFVRVRKVQQWLPKNSKDPAEDTKPTELAQNLQTLFAMIMKSLLWVMVIGLIMLILIYRRQLLAMLKPLKMPAEAAFPPDVLFGMDIRPESLPKDIAQACQQLWEQGQYREALSLLYRAALMYLTRHDQLPVHSSHTEGDILQLARQQLTGQRFAWLTAVTRSWQEIAYAHRTPTAQLVTPLFADWTKFAINTSAEVKT